MNPWNNDEELFALARRELFTSVVGDILDKLGRFHQFLPPEIKPLRPDMVVIGRAMPILSVDVYSEKTEGSANPLMAKPFGLMLEALDDLKPGEIYLNSSASGRNALWGEMLSTRAIHLGAAGAVVHGYIRDTKAVLNLNFPTFCWGSYGQDSSPRYKVVDYRVPIEIGKVRIEPGDLLFGDIDGVLVIPRDIEEEVINLSLEKARGEKAVQKAISNGMSACEAYEKYGIM